MVKQIILEESCSPISAWQYGTRQAEAALPRAASLRSARRSLGLEEGAKAPAPGLTMYLASWTSGFAWFEGRNYMREIVLVYRSKLKYLLYDQERSKRISVSLWMPRNDHVSVRTREIFTIFDPVSLHYNIVIL
uniref:Uncharacterized protein n=1 Tax=Leersia perrieri TaxID=77586 RepID=A0A0D9VR09_9ORYZ